MANIQAFHKIKEIRDQEKNRTQKLYQQNLEVFEIKATELYEVLKEKEESEKSFEKMLNSNTIQAFAFIQHQQYIKRLEKEIEALQPKVHEAREALRKSQINFNDAHVEVKKFEKLIEGKLEKQMLQLKEAENKQMDELSISQYIKFQNR